MNESWSERVLEYLKDKFPNHKVSDYEEATTYLCAMLIIERDKQFSYYMKKTTRGKK